MMPEYIEVNIPGAGRVTAVLLEQYPDGTCGSCTKDVNTSARGSDVEHLESRVAKLEAELVTITATLDELRAKVEGRNKSAPFRRNMTDADALKVLTGEYVDLGHKEAAEELGLTYAQVYSCRLGFTFKHVIRDLERAGWKSRWSKG